MTLNEGRVSPYAHSPTLTETKMRTVNGAGRRFRWLRNLAVYLALVATVTVAVGLAGAVRQGVTDFVAAIAGLIIGTAWLALLGGPAVVVYLVLVEFLLRGGRRRRLAAIAIAGLVPSIGIILSQAGHPLEVTPTTTLAVLSIAAVGSIYGAIVRLPPSPAVA